MFSIRTVPQSTCLSAVNMKRQYNSSVQGRKDGLKPYISKRKRMQEVGGSSSKPVESSVLSSEVSVLGSKLFTLNPTIACQVGDEVICKLPRQHNRRDFHGHQKAVTSLEWNVPSYSHLLLSSSLDREVKIWDCFTSKQCVRTLKCHKAGIKSAIWTADGHSILSGGFDKVVKLTDVQYDKTFQEFEMSSFITCLKLCPSDPQLFLAGTDDSGIYCWDMRIGEVVHQYKGKFGQILSVEFFPGRDEFVASSDLVCRNSDDRNILVFDLRSTAVISNQIYHEKYTCPSLKVHPDSTVFVAQSNGNYAAMFSTKPPFRLNKFKRFEGHQVQGYSVGCDISPDGTVIASGSSDGKLYFYDFVSTEIIKTLEAYGSACVNIQFHPVLGNILASSSWDGNVSVWR